jgi:hypothetical protein
MSVMIFCRASGVRRLFAAATLLLVFFPASEPVAQRPFTPTRPYMDSANARWNTRETTGYGKLAEGKGPTGWLLCREGEALVGVSAKRGRVLDRVQIHCAPVYPSRSRDPVFNFVEFAWSRNEMHPPDWGNYPDATAGGNGGQQLSQYICPANYLMAGMAAEVNLQNQIYDLVFECAKALGNFTTIPAAGGVDWFTERCQPTFIFAIFPIDSCLTDYTRQQINRERFRSGGGDYRAWLENQFGSVNTHRADDDQKCHQYGAVGLTFTEEPYATLSGITLVVTSLRLICIAHPTGWFRPSPPGRLR